MHSSSKRERKRTAEQVGARHNVKGARTMIRTINELLSVIGKNIEDIQDPKVSASDRQIKIERADNTAKLAKQFINACGLVQKGDVMANRHDRTDAVKEMNK